MVKGRMQCLGSPQHLKNRFGSGYVVRVVAGNQRNGAAPLSAVRQELQNRFPSMIVQDQHKSTLTAKIEGNFDLADLFEALETVKANMGLADYSASQTSLEQIFIRYARQDEAASHHAHPAPSQVTSHPMHSHARPAMANGRGPEYA